MADVRDEDFAAALTTAEKCILDGNGLIKTVQTYGEIHVIARLKDLCRTLDAGQGSITKVAHWHRVVSSGPFGRPPETEATAHELAWRFAHRLWGIVHTLLLGQEEFDESGEPTEGPGFAFREDVVLRHVTAIANLLRKQNSLDYYELRPHLRLERDKALAEFRRNRSSAPETTVAMPEVKSPAPDASDPTESVHFIGGTLMFSDDRVELCGVEIYSGPRSDRKRKLLKLLSAQRTGRFVAYSGNTLVGLLPAKSDGEVAGLIRDLRRRITSGLREVGIECGPNSVIQSGGPGYRFAESLSVQFADDENQEAVLGHNSGDDDPVRDPVKHADSRGDTVSDPVDDPVAKPDDPVARREWILRQAAAGRQLRAPHIAEALKCSTETAKRDLAALKDAKKIEFEGSPKHGFYRLTMPPAQADD
jgi:hypothetical protein